ncbi:MAG: glycine zipper domain-containing protein [Mariprofundaceae bacterium]
MFAYIRFIFLSLILFCSGSVYAADQSILGTLLGAGVGAAIGHSADRTGGAGKGAAIGAIGGYFIGKQINKNQAPAVNAPSQSPQCQQALKHTDGAAQVRNHTEKVFLLQNANRICSHNARIHNDLGVAYYQRGQIYDQQRARLELEEALRIDPNYQVAKQNLKAM